MKLFCVAVHPGTNVSHEFIVFEETGIRAVHKLNYNLRAEKKALQEKYPNDEYHNVRNLSDIINAIRRIGRTYKDRFAACHHVPVNVYELSEQPIYSVAYFQLGESIGYVSNLLSEVPLSAAQDSRNQGSQE